MADIVSSLSSGKIEQVEAQCVQLEREHFECDELNLLRDQILNLARKHLEAKDFIIGLSQGNLDPVAPQGNRLLDPFKELQARLRHLDWQTTQIAQGDYSQNIDFMGDFSRSFNSMVASLNEKKQLEEALKQSEASLKELNAEKDKFFSIIAHDLRGPFNTIIGFCNLVHEKLREGNYTDVQEFIGIIHTSTKQVLDLLVNLLEWSRTQTEQIKFSPETLDLAELVNQICDLYMINTRQKSITIHKKLGQNPMVVADKAMISTVLRNLISNAVKFTNTNGRIEISVHSNDHQHIVSIADDGIGIQKEKIGRASCRERV